MVSGGRVTVFLAALFSLWHLGFFFFVDFVASLWRWVNIDTVVQGGNEGQPLGSFGPPPAMKKKEVLCGRGDRSSPKGEGGQGRRRRPRARRGPP